MTVTNFIQRQFEKCAQGLLALALLVCFSLIGSVESSAQNLTPMANGVVVNLNVKGALQGVAALPANDAITNLQVAIDDYRKNAYLQTGANEVLYDMKITYLEAVRKDIADGVPVNSAINNRVSTLLETAARYASNIVGGGALQVVVNEAVALTH